MSRCLIAICVVLLLSSAKSNNVPRFEKTALLYTEAAEYKPLAWMTGGDRFPRGATILIADRNVPRSLVKGFASTADPNVSFDGTRILFAGKKAVRDHWQIWELGLAGGWPRQVSSCADDCVRPLYVPGDRLTYAEKIRGHFVIVISPTEGGVAMPVTYSPSNQLPTDILRDGRILFETAQPFGNTSISEIYTVYIDGSGVEAYRCDHGSSRHSARQIGSGDVVFARGWSLGRFTSALARQVEIAAPKAEYAGDVAEMEDGTWLLTSRASATANFAVFLWKPGTGSQRALITSQSNVVQPTLVSGRPAPNRHPSGLHDWSYANLLCLNAYTSKYAFRTGAIASVRLYSRGSAGREELLGESRVEKDGSFYLRTPADQPLKLELRDAKGKTLKKEAGWFWLRRGEQRVCVGCHAGPETAPENAVPAVLLRSTVAADMTSSNVPAGGH